MRRALFISLALLGASTAAAQTSPTEVLAPNQTLLEVQSTGQSYVAPDQATLTGGVVTFATTSREAADSNARAMAQVVAALKKAGVAPRDIQTQSVSLDPQSNYDRQGAEPPRITGYQARNAVTVRVRDVTKASELLTVLFEAGANDVNGPYFSIEDDSAAVAKARFANSAGWRSASTTAADVVTGGRSRGNGAEGYDLGGFRARSEVRFPLLT